MLIAGSPVSGNGNRISIHDPFRDDVVGTVPEASSEDIDRALAAATEGARHQASLPAGERAGILERVADLVNADAEDLATTIVREQGKTLAEARREVGRVPDLLRLCAGEARRLGGETIPLDQAAD